MAETVIKEIHLDLIVDRIHEGRCVPFLGAASNVKSEKLNYDGLPLGADVASELVKTMGEFKGRDPRDLARVSLQYAFETDRPALLQRLRNLLPDEYRQPSLLLQVLAQLPVRLVVTTNYDRLLERALQGVKKYETIIQQAEGFPSTPETRARFEELEGYQGLILYKIHGSFLDLVNGDDLSPVIITEEDYVQFLTVVGQENIGIPRLIQKMVVPSTLLFLGYSLEDWDFRTIYKGMIETLPKHQARKSFAIQKDPSEFWVSFWESKGVVIYNLDLYDFAEQLKQAYEKKFGKLSGNLTGE
ncbi:MAG TPA: SIR2 family protein [Anaerolineales bacterium]|nr:SIR2 family protein [Anaerolineales bacterium]